MIERRSFLKSSVSTTCAALVPSRSIMGQVLAAADNSLRFTSGFLAELKMRLLFLVFFQPLSVVPDTESFCSSPLFILALRRTAKFNGDESEFSTDASSGLKCLTDRAAPVTEYGIPKVSRWEYGTRPRGYNECRRTSTRGEKRGGDRETGHGHGSSGGVRSTTATANHQSRKLNAPPHTIQLTR